MNNIVITGANEGIGYYFIEQLLKDGNKIAVIDIETNNLEKLKIKYQNNLFFFKVDVRNEIDMHSSITKIAEYFHTIDIAIHNACLCTFDMEVDTNENTYKDIFEVNYFGALRLAKGVLPYMRKQKSGKIIFTSSGVGVTGFIGISPYASTKGALESLAKCLNLEYAKDNISFHIALPPILCYNI